MKATTQAGAPSDIRMHSGARIYGCVRLEGVVEHGDARGRELGYPTANISVPHGEIRDGVWAGTVCLQGGDDETYAAAVSVGRRPTYYSRGTRLLEAHLLDYNGDLYGRVVQVILHDYIRPQRRFRGTDELAAQIRDDVARVRSWANGVGRDFGREKSSGKPQLSHRVKDLQPTDYFAAVALDDSPRAGRCCFGSRKKHET